MTFFEDDLPENKTGDDLIHDMAAILITETAAYLAKHARFEEYLAIRNKPRPVRITNITEA